MSSKKDELLRGCAKAPSKVILFGEHSVVHGTPAIAVALNLRSYADIRVKKSSDNGKVTIFSKTLNKKKTYSFSEIRELFNEKTGKNRWIET